MGKSIRKNSAITIGTSLPPKQKKRGSYWFSRRSLILIIQLLIVTLIGLSLYSAFFPDKKVVYVPKTITKTIDKVVPGGASQTNSIIVLILAGLGALLLLGSIGYIIHEYWYKNILKRRVEAYADDGKLDLNDNWDIIWTYIDKNEVLNIVNNMDELAVEQARLVKNVSLGDDKANKEMNKRLRDLTKEVQALKKKLNKLQEYAGFKKSVLESNMEENF